MAQDDFQGVLSDGSIYRFKVNGRTNIWKDIVFKGNSYTFVKYKDGVNKEGQYMDHIYTVTSKINEEYYTARFGSKFEIINVEDGFKVEDTHGVTTDLFIEAVQSSNIFDFDNPEILAILGDAQ